MTKKIYKTMQGKVIDMDALLAKNETMPAVGNVRMNARGDELGPGGKIIRSREESVNEYYEGNPNAAPKQGAVLAPVVAPVIKTVAKAPAVTADKIVKQKVVPVAESKPNE